MTGEKDWLYRLMPDRMATDVEQATTLIGTLMDGLYDSLDGDENDKLSAMAHVAALVMSGVVKKAQQQERFAKARPERLLRHLTQDVETRAGVLVRPFHVPA